MAEFKLTMSKLKVLKENYYNTLKNAMDNENRSIKKDIQKIEYDEQLKVKQCIMKGLKESGFDLENVTDIDVSSTHWGSDKKYYDIASITVKCYIPNCKEAIPVIDKKAKKICEKWKKKFQELKDWEIKCIQNGVIYDFELPEVENDIRCD